MFVLMVMTHIDYYTESQIIDNERTHAMQDNSARMPSVDCAAVHNRYRFRCTFE